MRSIWQDLQFAVRTLIKAPGFAAVALLTLALGIGANAAMFSITDAVLLKPLAFTAADRLVFITSEDPSRSIVRLNLSYTRLTLLQQQTKTLESIGAFIPTNSSLVMQGAPEQVPAAIASRSLFQTFGVSPSLGRGFLPEEDQPGGAYVALVSDAFWHSHFGGNSDLIGQTLRLDGRSVQIVGVLPASFHFPFQQPEPQIWTPRVFENPFFPPDRVQSGASFLTVMGRLREGQSISQSQAELDSLGNAYSKTFPGFADATRFTARVEPLRDALVSQSRTSLFVLLAGVGFVLLIGCVNLASLLLARSTARRKEIAIRRALGATRWRLLRQLLTESVLLSSLGGAVGLSLAAGTPSLVHLLPPGSLPRIDEITTNSHVIWFSLGLCIFTGVLFGLVPALQTADINLRDALNEATRGSSGGARAERSRGALVVAEVAVALVVVAGAGLLIKSFGNLSRVNPGFDPQNVMTFSYFLPQSNYPTIQKQSLFNKELIEAVQALPFVQSVGDNTFLPIGGGIRFAYFCAEGTPCLGVGKDPVAAVRQNSPEYFNTMRIPLLRGRVFNDHDNAGSKNVSIINETLANQFFSGQDPIGKHLVLTRGNVQTEIVGVVASVRYAGLNAPFTSEVYVPQEQSSIPVSSMTLVVRSNSPTLPLVTAVRAAITKLDPDLPLSNIQNMESVVSTSVAQPRLTTGITAGFAILALLLAAIGIYGVIAYSVAQRRHEMAIRIALGAAPGDILGLIAKRGFVLIGLGIVIGIGVSLALTRFFASILFGVSARDPLTLLGVTTLLMVVGLMACYLPARRAMRVDPIAALREE